MNDCKIKSIDLRKEENKYYLDTVIKVEDLNFITETHTTLELPIKESEISVEFSNNGEKFLNLGFGFLRCAYGLYETMIIKEKEHEMTLADIEKKLGYKIKLVSEKENN